MDELGNLTGFDWDAGNRDKNWRMHSVTSGECEQVFFNLPLLVRDDPAHSTAEPRWYALGLTDTGRPLFIVFTIRQDRLRVISARDMNARERKIYAQENT